MSMASSSSSFVPTGGWTHDVFLSFRGRDTRNNFVDHLYKALVQKGIRVFKDDKMLRKGKSISPELLKAIEQSRSAVVVFSKKYVNSSWCLDELAKIMECQDLMGQKVLPVFYHVDPSDVREQKRDFVTAFWQHEEKYREEMDRVSRWRKALTRAGNLSGWNIKPDSGGESFFIDKIVQEISGDIQLHGLENNLIGIKSHIDELNSLLDVEATHEVRMVGICGMGGIGKTTIAQALFRRISRGFEGSSFVKSVRENSKRDICVVQQKILKDILETDHKFVTEDREVGAEMIQNICCNKKVVIVLDDVDDVEQLEFLAGRHEWFGAGSRILITTRDKRLLSYTNAKYQLACLPKKQAVELFSRHAFRKNEPPKGYDELLNRAIDCTGGLPLALKVLGSHFYGREASVWDSFLNRLTKTQNRTIFETLKISFDGLEDLEKKIFLDIACLFKGRDEEYVTKVLDSFGYHPMIGITVLIEKSLITVSKGVFDMHDLIQEMGLQIVRECSPNSRLWKHKEIHDFITKNETLEVIEALVIGECHYPYHEFQFGFHASVFENMKDLRLLDIHGKFTSCEPILFPNELRWLSWESYPFSYLPLSNMCKLVGLKLLFGKMEHLWLGQKVMPYLKSIDLFGCRYLKSFPDVSEAPNLERVILSGCEDLVEVHESLGSHKRLVYLDMNWCKNLKFLPSKIEMVSLETLILSSCTRLENFPEVSSCMVNLSTIDLNGCRSLKNIPNSICEPKYLKILNLRDCMKLQNLPGELGSLENLEELWLGSLFILRRQLESITFHTLTNLCCLKKLDLSWRQIKEEDFPNDLHVFSTLKELDLSGNFELIHLPISIAHILSLKYLGLSNCGQLENIQALPSGLQILKANNCKVLKDIPDLTKEYMWLYNVWLVGCKKLRENQDNGICLRKVLQQSFLQKCAAADHQLSIALPGRKIPSWFKEQQEGNNITLKLPPIFHTNITGFALCVLLQGELTRDNNKKILFKFGNNKNLIIERKSNFSRGFGDVENENVWIVYIPFSLLEQQRLDDFEPNGQSLFADGRLLISIYTPEAQAIRCGAHIVYKEDMDSIRQIKKDDKVSSYHKSGSSTWSGNTFCYKEKSSNMSP